MNEKILRYLRLAGKPLHVLVIAKALNIPSPTLVDILMELRRGGLVKSNSYGTPYMRYYTVA